MNNAVKHKLPSFLKRYAIAVLAVTLTFLLRLLLQDILGDTMPLLLFLTAVFISSYFGGLGPGIFATIVSYLLVDYFFIPPLYSVFILSPPDLLQVILFLLSGALISILSEAVHRSRRLAAANLAAAEASEERLRLLVEGAQDHALILLDPDGKIITWNAGAQRLYGYTAEEAIHQPLSIFYTPEEAAMGKMLHDLNLTARTGILREEAYRVRKDGSRFWATLVTTALHDPNGKLRGFARVVHDITAHKEADDRVRASIESNKRILHDLSFMKFALDQHAIVAITNAHGRITYVNDLFCQISQYSREELLGQNHRLINSGYHPKTFFQQMYATIGRGQVWHGQIRNRAKDGSIYWVDTTIVPAKDIWGNIVSYMAIRSDITHLKRTEEELRKANLEAEQANQAKDHFLATLSHELRTPLTPVLLLAQAIEVDPHLHPLLKSDIQMIRRNVELESRLIDDLLDLTRIARGKLSMHPETIDLHPLLQHALATCQESDLDAKRLSVILELNAVSTSVFGDAARLEQVFWNLLKNAAKFTPANGRIAIRSFNNSDNTIVVQVADTGIGIAPEILPHIFDAFEQGGIHVTKQFGGLGLGLAISRAIVQRHHGDITAQSSGPGHGATFTVSLPTTSAVKTSAPTQPTSSNQHPHHHFRILLVEDHENTAQVMMRLLNALGHHVQIASSVQSALDLAAQQPFDLIISDLGLPDGHGHDLMRQLKKLYHLRGIALSGYGMEDDVRRSREAGFETHLIKPVHLTALEAAINHTAPQE